MTLEFICTKVYRWPKRPIWMGGCPSIQTVKQLQVLLLLPQKNLNPAFKRFPLQFTCAPSTRSEWTRSEWRERERERERNCESALPNNTTKQSGHGFGVILNWASKVMHCCIGFASLCSVIGPKITALLFLGQFVSFYFEFWSGSSDFSIVLIGHWYFFDFGFKTINIEICFNPYSRVQQANWLAFIFPLIFLCHNPRIILWFNLLKPRSD